MIVHFSALFLEDEDEKKVLPGDKTNLLWDMKYLKKSMYWILNFSCTLSGYVLPKDNQPDTAKW